MNKQAVFIYCLFNNNGPFYIGKTKNSLKKREKQHQKRLKDNCEIFKLDLVNENEWKFWEQYYIDLFKSWNFNLKNKNKGGGGPSSHTENTRQKMSNTSRPGTSQKLKGIKRPDVSKRFKGQYFKPETIQKIIDKKTNHPCYSDPARGEKIKNSNQIHYQDGSDRNIKIQQKLTGREITWSDKFKIPILQYDKQGNFIKEWESATDIGIFLNKQPSALTECCLGKRKSAYGFIWKYKLNLL